LLYHSVARGGYKIPPQWPEEEEKKGKHAFSTYAVCLQRHRFLMTFKSILRALKGGGELKFIDVTTNFSLLLKKESTKFACFQTLKVILANAHGK